MNGGLLDGRYRLEREIARDADQVTYAAVDERLGRAVAVRLFSPARAADAAFLAASQQAVARAAALTHPNVLQVYDTRFDAEQPYVVEALVDGASLAQRMASGERCNPADIQRLARQAAGALAAAHAAGLVHGSLSPEALWIGQDGDLRIAGFGRPVSAEPSLELGRCLPPEQALGSQPDARSDIYSLAVVLYQMIDGQPPFDGPNLAAINLSKLSTTPRPLAAVAPQLPPALLRAVESSLSANPAERPANGTVFRDRLDQAASTAPAAAPLDPTVALERTQIMPAMAAPRPTSHAPTTYAPLPPEPLPERGAGALPWLGGLLVVAVIAVLWFALGHPNAELPKGDAGQVPAVVNLAETEALTKLKALGLQPTVTERRMDETVPGGQVLDQKPAAGSPLPEDKIVKLVISSGPSSVAVPELKGLASLEARKALAKTGLRAKIETAQNLDFPDGAVVAQSPVAGQKVAKGAAVTLVVNKLPKDETKQPPKDDKKGPDDAKKGGDKGSLADTVADKVTDEVKQKTGEVVGEVEKAGKKKLQDAADSAKDYVADQWKGVRKRVGDRISGTKDDKGN